MAAPQKAKEKILWLRSSDNEKFEVNESAAIQSVTLMKMMEDDCADKVIPLPNITSHILVKVIEYCNKHAEPTGPGDAVGATNKSAEDWLFDADFVNVEQDTLIDLMLAANYLDIKGLLNLTRQTITDMVMGKMPEEVCKVTIQKKLSTSSTSALTTTMSSKRKQMEAGFDAYLSQMQETAMEMLTGFAVRGEECRKLGHPPEQPPLDIVNYPELMERAWGWDSILPYFPVNSWSLYMTYLQEYYKRNSPEVLARQVEANAATIPDLNGDDGNDVTTLFNSCINLEDQLLNTLSYCDKKHNVDEISLKDKLTSFAHQTTIVEYAGFTTTSVALKCIMAETYLLFELLKSKTGMVPEVIFCSRIRKLAFGFMTYKGPRCVEAAATMMAITKEAKLMRELLKNKCEESNGPFSWSVFIRERTFDAMFRISKECSAVEESTGGNTASKLISDESGDNNPSEQELVNKDNLLQRNKMNQNTKIYSKEELPKENHLDERNEAGSEMGIVGDNVGEMNVAKQTTKVCNESDDKVSLKENVVANTKIEDSFKTSSGFDEKDQGKGHTRTATSLIMSSWLRLSMWSTILGYCF